MSLDSASHAAARATHGIVSKKVVLDDYSAILDELWCIWKGTATVVSMCPSAMRDVCDVTRERGARESEAMVRKPAMAVCAVDNIYFVSHFAKNLC